MSNYLDDYKEDDELNFGFNSYSSGVPFTLAGGVVEVYKKDNAIQSAAGVTLTVDFDSTTGLHHVKVDLSSDPFYAIANDYKIVLTAGTIDGVSAAGSILAHFSIENRVANDKLNTVGTNVTAIKVVTDALPADIKKLLAWNGENIAFGTITYDINHNPTSIPHRLYDTKVNAQLNDGLTGLLDAYTQVATYNLTNNRLLTFEITKD